MKEHENKLIVPILEIGALLLIIAGILFFVDVFFFAGNWLTGESWVSIILCLISSGATLILGYISCWQNKKQREDNIKAQENIQRDAARERQFLIEQRNLEVLVKGFDKYRDKLETIDMEIQKLNYSACLNKICRTVLESAKTDFSREKVDECREITKNIIASLNYIQNNIIYTYGKYYINAAEPLILNLASFRKAIGDFTLEYLEPTLDEQKAKLEKMKIDAIDLRNKICQFEVDWQNYLTGIVSYFEYLEYNDSPESILLKRKTAIVKMQELRKKVNDLTKKSKG